MATIENFILRFKTEGTNALGAVSTQLGNIGQQAGAAGEALMAVGARMGPLGAVAGAAAAAFAALGLRAAAIAAQLSDLSNATGISASGLLSFKQSIIEAGGGADDFQKIAAKLNQSVQEAAGGNEKLQKAFQALGVFVTDASGKLRPTEQILADITQRFKDGQINGAQYAAAIDILGKNANRLELAKLQIINDPFKDEQIAQLDKYNEAMDRISASVENKMITVFGRLALQIEDTYKKSEEIQKKLEERGRSGILSPETRGTIFGLFGMTPREPVITRELTPEERAARDRQAEYARQAQLMRGYRTRAPSNADGTYGATPEATVKAVEDSKTRIIQSQLEARKQLELSVANDIQKIEINAKFEAERAKAEIFAKERLTEAQKAAEYSAKEKEIFAKRDADIANNRRQLNAKIFTEEMAQAEQNARELAQYYQQVDQARLQAWDQVDAIRRGTEELQGRLALQTQIQDVSTIEADRLQKIFDLEQQRKQQLEAISKIKDLPYDERLAREKELNAEFEKRIGLINQEAEVRAKRDQDFAAGFRESMRRYEESLTPLRRGQDMANAVFQNMDRALGNFVNNGKFNFKDFANSVIRDLLLIELRASTVSLFKSVFGGLGTALGFRANGGPVAAGQPYVVGERGAELFVPSTGGTIISNNQLQSGGAGIGSTNVVYNIQAVDASSFRQLVARDPAFIYAVTEQGRKTLPSTRR